MESKEKGKLKALASAVLPAVCYIIMRFALGQLCRIAFPETENALQALIVGLLLLPPVAAVYFRTPRAALNEKQKRLPGMMFTIIPAALCITAAIIAYIHPANKAGLTETAALCFLAPIEEELIYRGAVFGRARAHFSLPAAFLLSIALFTAGHSDIFSALISIPAGFVFCLVTVCTGLELSAILLHIAWNLIVTFLITG